MRTVFFAIVGTVALATLAVSTIFGARERALADADRELATRAQFIADSFDRLVQNRMIETFTFAALPSMRGYIASDETTRPSRMVVAQAELQAIVASDPSVGAASIVDMNGRVILTTDDSMNADWGVRLFVKEGMLGHLYASAPARDYGEVWQYYSAPVIDNFGNVGGVLVVRVATQELWDVLRSVEDVLVLDEYGVRIADSSATPQLFSAIAPLANDAAALVFAEKRYGAEIALVRAMPLPVLSSQIKSNSNASSASFPDSNGTMMRAAILRLGTNSWHVIVMRREDVILSSMTPRLWQVLGWSGAGAFFAGMIVYLAKRGRQSGA